MNKPIKSAAVISCLLLSVGTFSQRPKSETIEFQNAEGVIVTEKKARLLTRRLQINDTCWQFEYYKMKGPMLSSVEYKEKAGKTRHGRASFMRPDGTLDSTGTFANSLQDGTWLYFSPNGALTATKEYSHGALSSTSNTDDKKDVPDKEAAFPDGANGWMRHLIKNLRYPIYAQDNELQGTATVYFQVDAEGNVHDPILIKSAAFSLDQEAVRMLQISLKWIPATKNGQAITSFKQQPIMFRLERAR